MRALVSGAEPRVTPLHQVQGVQEVVVGKLFRGEEQHINKCDVFRARNAGERAK